MPDKIFQIFGATVPRLLGRQAIMDRLWSSLTKPTPDFLQMVGPRFSGKSVILQALAEKMANGVATYNAVILWDLGHETPESDEGFMRSLRDQLVKALESVAPEYATYLRDVPGNPHKEIAEVFDECKGRGIRVLMLWDSFDEPLRLGKLSRNLWDQLLTIASGPSLRIVTASRRPLHELLRDQGSAGSKFWGIFDMTPVRVECFDDNDIKAVMLMVPNLVFNAGAQTELLNWSGAFPPLVLSLLNALHLKDAKGTVDAGAVNACADRMNDDLSGLIGKLWNDCPASSKDLYRGAIEAKGIEMPNYNHPDLAYLKERGFTRYIGGKVLSNCRFLEKHLLGHSDETGSMSRMFGTVENYFINSRPLLERRLAHIKRLDLTLRRFIERGIEDIPDHPDVCLQNVRGIVDKAIDLIWDAELGKNRHIPSDWFAVWKYCGETGPDRWNEQFPAGNRAYQLGLLHLMTGTTKSARKAAHVTKNTYYLVNAAHGFGNFGQHPEGAKIDVGVAFAALCVCVELAASIERELP